MNTAEEIYNPTHYAILHDGNGTPPYPIPRMQHESTEEFTARIASIVIRGIVEYPYTSFVEVIDVDHGNEDTELTGQVVQGMQTL